MIILVKLFLPGGNLGKNVSAHVQQVVAESIMAAKPEEFGENDYCQVNIITDPLSSLKNDIVVRNKDNLIQVKKNNRNLFRNTTDILTRESEKFEKDLLKKISFHIGNNLKILY